MFKMKTIQRSLVAAALIAALPMAAVAQGKEPVNLFRLGLRGGPPPDVEAAAARLMQILADDIVTRLTAELS